MFFIGIFGIQNGSKEIREYSNTICQCGRLSRAILIEEYMYFHFFFIPVFKWGRKYYVQSRCCGRIFSVPEEYVDELKKSDTVDFERLREIKEVPRRCPECGYPIQPDFTFCPHCGKRFTFD